MTPAILLAFGRDIYPVACGVCRIALGMARYTQQQLDDLRAAIAEGVLRVSSNGRSVEYRSISEMQQLERIMAAELEPDRVPQRRTYLSFRRA